MYEYYFERMNVWKNSRDLVNDIYTITRKFPQDEDYHLKSQMRRAAGSVKSNIAEGQGRITKVDQARFTTIAYSSLIELLNHLITALDQCYILENQYLVLREKINLIANQLNSLKKVQLSK